MLDWIKRALEIEPQPTRRERLKRPPAQAAPPAPAPAKEPGPSDDLLMKEAITLNEGHEAIRELRRGILELRGEVHELAQAIRAIVDALYDVGLVAEEIGPKVLPKKRGRKKGGA